MHKISFFQNLSCSDELKENRWIHIFQIMLNEVLWYGTDKKVENYKCFAVEEYPGYFFELHLLLQRCLGDDLLCELFLG